MRGKVVDQSWPSKTSRKVVLGAVCFFVVSASRGGCLPLLLVLSGRVAMVASVPRGGCFALVDGRGDCGALVVSVLRVGL